MKARDIVAAAARGDLDALARVAADPALARVAVQERLAPRLARVLATMSATARAPQAAGTLLQAARGSAVAHLYLDEILAKAAPALAGIPWCLIKGADLRERLYDHREDRVVGDVDVLVSAADFDAVRQRALSNGFRDLHEVGPHYLRFLQTEAHAWQATLDNGGLLEVHPRLWGLLPSSAGADVLAGVALGASGDPHRPCLTDAYLLCAVHAFLDPPPRRLATWFELAAIAARLGPDGHKAVETRARHWGAELLLVAAARAVGRWCAPGMLLPGANLTLRATERLALRGPRADDLGYGRLALARLLAARPSRMGWLGVWRRLWPHPGLVERATPSGWRWPRRRLEAIRRGIG